MVTAVAYHPHPMHNHGPSHGFNSISDGISAPENNHLSTMNMNGFSTPNLARNHSEFSSFSGMYDNFSTTKPNLMHQDPSYSNLNLLDMHPQMSPSSLTSVPSYGSLVTFDPALARVQPTRSVSFMTSLTGEDEPQIEQTESQLLSVSIPSPLPIPNNSATLNSHIPIVHMDTDPSIVKGTLRRYLNDGSVSSNISIQNYPQIQSNTHMHGLRKRNTIPLYPVVAHNSEYGYDYKPSQTAVYDTATISNAYSENEVGQKRSRHTAENHRLKSHDSDGESVDSHGSDTKRLKARHVSPAVKLVGNEEGNSSIVTTVTQMHYETKEKRHRIRLIRVQNLHNGSDNVYAHGADVGSVVERKSNISRLFGKFKSPQEKLLMNVPGPHNHTVGQESNILTVAGLQSFLHTNKMRGQTSYANWINRELIPHLEDPKSTESLEAESDERPAQPRKQITSTNSLSRVPKKNSPSSEPNAQSFSPSSLKI